MGDAVPVSAPGAGAAAARSDRKGLASAVPPARVGSFTAGSLRDVKLSSVRLLKSCESMADERRGLQLKEGVDRVRLNAYLQTLSKQIDTLDAAVQEAPATASRVVTAAELEGYKARLTTLREVVSYAPDDPLAAAARESEDAAGMLAAATGTAAELTAPLAGASRAVPAGDGAHAGSASAAVLPPAALQARRRRREAARKHGDQRAKLLGSSSKGVPPVILASGPDEGAAVAEASESPTSARAGAGDQSERSLLLGSSGRGDQEQTSRRRSTRVWARPGEGRTKVGGEAAMEQIVKDERAVQEQIESEMLPMAAMFLEQSKSIHRSLAADNAKLGQAEEVIEGNLARVSQENRKISERVAASWSMCCGTFGLLLSVVVVFCAMYIFIRVTPRPT